MRKRVLVIFAVALLAFIAVPAMATPTTVLWSGSTSTAFSTTSNWVGGLVPQYQTAIFDSTSHTNSCNVTSNPQISISDSYNLGVGQNTFTVTGSAPVQSYGATVAAGCNLIFASGVYGQSGNIVSPANGGTGQLINVGTGGYLECGVGFAGSGTVSGGGLVNLNSAAQTNNSHGFWIDSDNTTLEFNPTSANPTLQLNGLKGVAASTFNCTANVTIDQTISSGSLAGTQGFAFTGQINYTCNGQMKIGDPTGNLAVTGMNLMLTSQQAQTQSFWIGTTFSDYNSVNQICDKTFTDCKFTGDGNINATNSNYSSGTPVTMVSNGTSISATATNTATSADTQVTNGQFTVTGNLQLGKDGSGNLSTIGASVMSASGVLGTGYTQTRVLVGWDNGGTGGGNVTIPGHGSTYRYSQGGFVTCPDSTTNDLQDTNLVVNITPGLSNSALAGEILPIFTVYNTDLSAASFFANCPVNGGTYSFTGGSATVTIVPDTYGGSIVELSNIYSNPVPEPATMCLLAMGGLGMLLRNRRK